MARSTNRFLGEGNVFSLTDKPESPWHDDAYNE